MQHQVDTYSTAVRGEHDIVVVRAVQLERRSFVAATRGAQQAEKRSSSSPLGWIIGTIATVGLIALVLD